MHKKKKLLTITIFILLTSYILLTITCAKDSYLFGDDIGTLRAKAREGKIIIVPGKNLDSKLKWLDDYLNDEEGEGGGDFVVEVNADESIDSYSFDSFRWWGSSDITITLKSIGTRRIIRLFSIWLFSDDITLILDNIILQKRYSGGDVVIGGSGNINNYYGTLIMNEGSAIINGSVEVKTLIMNEGSSIINGGVSGGTLLMNEGSAITNGGVSVGNFTMNGGKISGNTISSGSTNYGGGVYVGQNATFTMNGGKISGNTVSSTFSSSSYSSSSDYGSYGGGVYVSNGTFNMSGGEISGNTVSSTFSSSSYSSSSNYGSYGGGVYVSNGTFTMSGGEISGNTVIPAITESSTSNGFGGGLYISSGSFKKTGGIIYGYSDDSSCNVVKNSDGDVQNNRGHAIYANYSTSMSKRKETTAGTGESLTFNYSGSGMPSWTGNWDN